jgi:predicted nucleic acid-binding Zn ribbon protein
VSAGDDPARVGDALDAIRRELGMGAPSELDAIDAAWGSLVGAALAAHSRPQTVRGGVLVVVADAAAWAGQLRYLDQVLVDRIAEELPGVTVHEVRVSVPRDAGSRPRKPGPEDR